VTVRLIGVDTPETRKPRTPVECGGPQATESMRSLGLERDGTGRAVWLITDPTQDRKDRYGRLLAYVVDIARGQDLGGAQVSRGWSTTYVYDQPFQRLAGYQRRQRAARNADRGAWSLCDGNFHRSQNQPT
jgi:micrococcal nuclease